MKKLSIFVMMATLMLFLAACGSTNNTDSSPNEESADTEQTDKTTQEGEEANTGSEDADTIEIAHQLDPNPVVVNKNPEKIVVFDFGFLDTLKDLNIEVAGLPQANVPAYLSEYEDEKYKNVGSLKEPDFEAIHALQPDVIFISGRQMDLYEEFAAIAPTVFVGIDTNNYLESFKANMNLVADLFDKKEEIDAELAEIDAQIAEISEKASAADEKALIILGTEGKMSAYGPSSRFGVIHDVLGFKAADENIEVSTHGQSVSFEYILETNPGILFVVDRDAAVGEEESGVKQTLENELVQKTDAYKNNKIIYLNPEYWYLSGGGLLSFKEMIKEVAEAL